MSPYSNIFSLAGKLAVVTGGAGLIGSQIVLCLAAHGGRVVLVDVDRQAGQRVVDAVVQQEGTADVYTLDLLNLKEMESQLETLEKRFGAIDIWVNAHYPKLRPQPLQVENLCHPDWEQNIHAHLNSYCVSCIEIAKRMARRNCGSIVNLASIYGMQSPDFSIYADKSLAAPPDYSAIKGGIIAMSKYVAGYYGDKGVRVNAICPGGVANNQPEEFVRSYNRKTMLKRMAAAEEIAPAVLFLASEAASYVTGTVLTVDAGLSSM